MTASHVSKKFAIVRRNRVLLGMGILACIALSVLAQTSPQAATAGDVQKMVDQGQYRPALQQIAKLLPQMQDPATQQQRYTLLMLRGECLLQLGERSFAVSAFEAAGHIAPDPKSGAVARANAVLVRRSTGTTYKPKGGGKPIDILAADSRKQAMLALDADLSAAIQPRVNAAISSDTLQPTIDLLPAMLDMDALECTANGVPGQTRQQLMAMGQHARELMNREIRRVGLRFDELMSLSDSSTWGNNGPSYTVTGGTIRRNFTTPQLNEMNSLLAYVKQIETTARKARQFAHEMGLEGKAWEPVIADSDDLIDRFNAVLVP
jgi:hypothetical protein